MAASGGRIVPAPGGVLIRDAAGDIVGAVGISGDTSDKDETVLRRRDRRGRPEGGYRRRGVISRRPSPASLRSAPSPASGRGERNTPRPLAGEGGARGEAAGG